MNRHLVWDWNGTLFDDRAATFASMNAVLIDYGVAPVDERLYRTRFRRPIRLYYEEVLDRRLDDQEWLNVDTIYYEHYRRAMDEVTLAPDAVEALELARRRGWTQSILSMWLQDELRDLVDRLGISGYFARVDGNVLGNGDPKQDLLALHVESLGVPAGSCRLVGDTVDDALAAKAVGAECMLYPGGLHTPAMLAEHGPVVEALTDASRLV